MPKKTTLTDFLNRANEIHQGQYDYSKVVFSGMNVPIIITCPLHGDFSQKPSVHINDKCGCPRCGKNKQGKKIDFYAKSHEVHGDTYDYSKVKYTSMHKNVIIKCRIHGEFSQRPDAHIYQKQGCPTCGYEHRIIPHQGTTDKFIKAANKRWNTFYDYSKTTYENKNTKIKYICPKHGEISQKPLLHLRSGCPYCNGRGISQHTRETFIAIANKVHDNRYDYSLVKLNKITDYIKIICKKHGVFEQRANNHIHLLNGCPHCTITSSLPEKEILAFIKENYKGIMLENDRKVLGGKEIDIYIPELKLGIEYHGMYWHTETLSGKKKHWEKANLASSLGVKLIQVYEQEWKEKQDIVKSKIRCLLGKVSRRIFARKTVVRKLTRYEKDVFLDSTHVQGRDGSTFAYGLFFKEELVACMTFGTSRFSKKFDWELIRYSSARDTVVVGGAAKLLKYFRRMSAGSVISYADRRWSDGNLYYKLGFRLDGVSNPSFCYFHIGSRKVYNRMKFQKKFLSDMKGFDKKLKEYEIMQLNGYDRVWDAGQLRFVLG